MSAPPPTAAEPAAVSDAEFARQLAAWPPFERAPRLAVAVSGGGDSMALAALARDWAQVRGGSVIGLIVDHGLRPESGAEARATAARLATIGIDAEVLTWAGPKPCTGVQEAARAARLSLLTAACRRRGILHLLLGHHLVDQAETVAMRAAAGSGPDGLAGMAAVLERDGVRLLRPLLAFGRDRLRSSLRSRRLPWIDDPSNTDRRYERSRLRAEIGFPQNGWSALGRERAERRARLDGDVARFLARHARLHPLGFARLEGVAFDALEPELRATLLARLLRTIGGGAFPPRATSVQRLLDDGGLRRSLGGCLIRRTRAAIEVVREPARVHATLTLAARDEVHWDRRWHLVAGELDAAVEVRVLGGRATLLPRPVRRRLAARQVPAVAVAALPSLWRGQLFLGCPAFGDHRLIGGPDVVARLRAAQPFAPAPHVGPIVVSN